jgi:leucyl aminopeptidase (aminopeptidase T)
VDNADLVRAAAVLVRAPASGGSGGQLAVDGEPLVIVADDRSRALADLIARAARQVGAFAAIYRLDLLLNQTTGSPGGPHRVLPSVLETDLTAAPSSVFLARALPRERAMRIQLRDIVRARGQRHAYLPDITESAFAAGLRIPQDEVVATGHAIGRRLRGARLLKCESPAGTNLTIALPARDGWVARLGEIESGKATTYPAGEIFAAPEDARGTFVADASLGEFFGAREGLLVDRPVRFTIEGARVKGVDAGPNAELQRDIDAFLRVSPNSNRVGLVCVGVNAGVGEPTGDAAVDHLLVGLHLFFGDPAGASTGAMWSARTSLAACQTKSRVIAAGSVVIDGGRVVPPDTP